jgi:hypothetical protein
MYRAFVVSAAVLSGAVVCGTASVGIDVEAAQAQTAPAAASASQVRITNAKLQPAAASGALTAQVKALTDRQTEPAWIAYLQPIVDSSMGGCCGNWNDGQYCCGGCALESRTGTVGGTSVPQSAGPIKLEGARELIVLVRVEAQRIDRVQVYSGDCDLDAGGLVVHVLNGVRAVDSIAFLESTMQSWPANDRKGMPDSAIMGIALHKDPAADATMQRLLAPTQTDRIRKKALFWTARARGRQGFETARRMLKDDASPGMQKEAVFALTQSREPEVVPTLIDAARTHPAPEVRSQALFWLAQKAGKEAEATITRAIDEDPETSVKERAVFALSQLPKDEGIPLLIQVARTNKNTAVRKKAMFWLGQSKDPRAIDFFESVLK